MRALLSVVCVSGALFAAGEVRTVPACGFASPLRIEREGENYAVFDSRDTRVLWVRTFPQGRGHHAGTVVSQACDHVVFDVRAAFRAGARKVLVWSEELDLARYAGCDTLFATSWDAPKDAELTLMVEGVRAGGAHWWRSKTFRGEGRRSEMRFLLVPPVDMENLHISYALNKPGSGPVRFYGTRTGSLGEMERAPLPPPPQRLLFHAPFDGSPRARVAGGKADPVCQKGLSYAPGRYGQAVRLTDGAKSLLAYAASGNVSRACGALSFWFKREWPEKHKPGYADTPGHPDIKRALFDWPHAETPGAGGLYFWWWGGTLRLDRGDKARLATCYHGIGAQTNWQHYVICWDANETVCYRDGNRLPPGAVPDDFSPQRTAVSKPALVWDAGAPVSDRFYVGMAGGEGRRASYLFNGRRAGGLIDEFKIWAAPFSAEEARALYDASREFCLEASSHYACDDEEKEVALRVARPDGTPCPGGTRILLEHENGRVCWSSPALEEGRTTFKGRLPAGSYCWVVHAQGQRAEGPRYGVLRATNRVVRASAARGGVPDRLVPVATYTFSSSNMPASCFRSVGACRLKACGGVPYLEAGGRRGDRFALRIKLDRRWPLHVFEIEWPDDAARTADIIVQPCRRPQDDYILQVGVMTGGEYPCSGRIRTHRCLYWTAHDDVALVFMTARPGEPPAVSRVRVYRVADGALPQACVQPAPETAHGRRHYGMYYEDPALNWDFAAHAWTLDGLNRQIDRLAAYMKYAGHDLLAYPGAWYHGLIDEAYNPRRHAPHFLEAFYEKFDREGLSLVPTLNVQTLPFPPGRVTRHTMCDGSLHGTALAIHDTGYPNWGGWHGTSPNFCVYHPDVQEALRRYVDTLLDQGVSHPSFKGVCLHLTSITLPWWGSLESGYNDYVIEAFMAATGVRVAYSRTDRARGRQAAEWIKKHAREAWIGWRAAWLTEFYASLAARIRARRADLKLWVHAMPGPPEGERASAWNETSRLRALREAGIDPRLLAQRITNLVFSTSFAPAASRHDPSDAYRTPRERAHLQARGDSPHYYAGFADVPCPWLNLHDTYWESPIGAAKGAEGLSCDWLEECTWRVTAINAPGHHARKYYARALRYNDVLGFSRGGFLVGSYGSEASLVPFMQHFRALPAVRFETKAEGDVVLRHARHAGRSWFYVLNTTDRPQTVRGVFPAGARALAGNIAIPPPGGVLPLEPYGLMAFSAPQGCLTISKGETRK